MAKEIGQQITREIDREKKKLLFSLGGLNVFLLGLVSLLNDFSSEMIHPLLPLLLTSLGSSGLSIGLIGGLMEGLPNLFKVFFGYFSDRLKKRRRIIALGYSLSQVSKLALILAKSANSVMIFVGFDRIGKGIREAPRDALISESMPKEKGKAFGIQRTFDSTGAILGSLTVMLLVLFFASRYTRASFITQVIFVASLIGFLSLVPLMFVREKRKNILRRTFTSSLEKLSGKLWLFIFIAGIFALANFSYMFFVLKASSLFTGYGEIIPIIPIALYVFFNIFYTAFAIPFGRLSDRIGKKKIIISGYILFSLVSIGFLIFSSLFSYAILFLLYGLVYAMTVGVQRAYVSDISRSEIRATALGAFQTVIGLAAIISGLISGYLYDLNKDYVFIYGAIVSLLAVVLFLFLKNPKTTMKQG